MHFDNGKEQVLSGTYKLSVGERRELSPFSGKRDSKHFKPLKASTLNRGFFKKSTEAFHV